MPLWIYCQYIANNHRASNLFFVVVKCGKTERSMEQRSFVSSLLLIVKSGMSRQLWAQSLRYGGESRCPTQSHSSTGHAFLHFCGIRSDQWPVYLRLQRFTVSCDKEELIFRRESAHNYPLAARFYPSVFLPICSFRDFPTAL